MESSITDFLKKWWWLLLLGLVLLVFVVAWLNTPHQDSTERPLPRKEEKQLIQQRDRALKTADSLRVAADSLVVHSKVAYEQGVEAGEEAMKARLETHQKPTTHAPILPTPASTKQLQQYFNEY